VTVPVQYQVEAADPRGHQFRVSAVIEHPAAQALVLRLPSWIRGSYLIRDFAKHISGLHAWRGEREVAVERIDKRSFRVPAGEGAVRIEYRVYAFDESVRKAFLDLRRGFFNGSSLFYCPGGYAAQPFDVLLKRPDDPALKDWKVATTLAAVDVDGAGFGHYRAEDYEALIDHPVVMGLFQRHDFDVDGIPHALVLSGRMELDAARVVRDLARICKAEREMFGNEPALPQYLFLTHVVASGYGGLEHRASSALIAARSDFPRPGQASASRDYGRFLGLCSHEYFHLWNVKRITARAFLESDLAAEAYTRDLWHYEGVTSYYDDLFLLRAGLCEAADYLDLLAEHATRLQRNPARKVHTLADASFETWIKYYQPDENSPNASTNYYVKGALAALCTDLLLRRDSSVTLDDVMRALWTRHGRGEVGVPEGGLEALAQELSGLDLHAFFDLLLRSTEELPLAELLADFGVRGELRACTSPIDDGGRTHARNGMSYLGLRLRAGETVIAHVLSGGPAHQAGLCPGDQMIALDGYKLGAANWNRRVETLTPGREVELHFFRGEELMMTHVAAQPAPLDTWTFTLAEAAGPALERRRRWLGA
jgi:predicted metalloprotease with PDZ domain